MSAGWMHFMLHNPGELLIWSSLNENIERFISRATCFALSSTIEIHMNVKSNFVRSSATNLFADHFFKMCFSFLFKIVIVVFFTNPTKKCFLE